ncbi:MAG: hypothetical protein HGA47_01555 [Zoogloea sp.]|nr:hypothetical protein [Zoogloea sp.]
MSACKMRNACWVVLGLMLPIISWAVDPAASPVQRIEKLETRLDALDKDVGSRLDAGEKLVQATAIAQGLENGRKEVDWWLSAVALFLGVVSVSAVAVPYLPQKRQKENFDAELKNIHETFDRLQVFERDTKDEVRRGLDELRDARREAHEHRKLAEQEAGRAASARE